MKRIVRLTENDLSRIVKRVLEEESNLFKKNRGMRKYDPTITDRVMVTLDGESIPNEKYPEVYYGYDNIKRKVVQATGNRRFGAVFHYCGLPQPNSVNYDYKMISTQENPYETHNIDMDQQRIIDERWLTKICESIRWKPKKD